MPRRSEDPRVTDLRRYRKARELQRRAPPSRPRSERFLGDRPGAAFILLAVILALAAASLLPRLYCARLR
jgi:hypothetical protein